MFSLILSHFHLILCLGTSLGDVLDLANFQLRPNAQGAALRERTDKLGAVLNAPATVTNIMNNLNRPDTANRKVGSECNKDAVITNDKPDIDISICFSADDATTGQWIPQGVTTVADMQADQTWGDGYKPILVSWYDKNNEAQEGNKGVRISFVDQKTGKYRHALLVYPKEFSGRYTYESIRVSQAPSADGYKRALHAGGILWYGNHLFVADTGRGFRMFDVRRIYDLGASSVGSTSGADKIGLETDGKYYAHGYRYIMPQTGSWTRTAEPGVGCSDVRDVAPKFSYVSLDRSTSTHFLVAGEYCNKSRDGLNWPDSEAKSKGRVAVWRIQDSFQNGELVTDTDYRWNAIAAYKLPVYRIQGVTRFDGKWYLSQSNGKDGAGRMFITKPLDLNTVTLEVASNQSLSIGPEDLSHWAAGSASNPALGTIWTVAEHEDKRMLYSVKPKN